MLAVEGIIAPCSKALRGTVTATSAMVRAMGAASASYVDVVCRWHQGHGGGRIGVCLNAVKWGCWKIDELGTGGKSQKCNFDGEDTLLDISIRHRCSHLIQTMPDQLLFQRDPFT